MSGEPSAHTPLTHEEIEGMKLLHPVDECWDSCLWSRLIIDYEIATARAERAERTLDAVALFTFMGEGEPEDFESVAQQLNQDGYNEGWLQSRRQPAAAEPAGEGRRTSEQIEHNERYDNQDRYIDDV